jgi:hypothetical protein
VNCVLNSAALTAFLSMVVRDGGLGGGILASVQLRTAPVTAGAEANQLLSDGGRKKREVKTEEEGTRERRGV